MTIPPMPPLTNNLGQFASPLLGSNPTGRYCYIGPSREGDESGEYGTMPMGLLQLLPVQLQWGYLGTPAANGHLRTGICSLGGTDVVPGGTLQGSGGLNPAPCTVHSQSTAMTDGAGLGTIEFGNLKSPRSHKIGASGGSGTFTENQLVTQATSGATGTFVAEGGGFVYLYRLTGTFDGTHAISGADVGGGAVSRNVSSVAALPDGYGDPGTTNTDLSAPLSNKLRMFRGGDPFVSNKCWVRLLIYKTAGTTTGVRFLARRNGSNYAPYSDGPDTNPLTFPAGTGFKAAPDAQVSGLASGQVSAYIGAIQTATKELHVVGMGLYAKTTNVIPDGPRWFTMGRSAQTLEHFCLYLGDDWGNGTQPYSGATDGGAAQVAAAQANAQAWMSFMSGGDGTTSGPTDFFISCPNRGSTYTYGGLTELAAINAGDYTVTLSLYQRIIDRLNTIGINLNGSKPRICIITPDIAAYDATPYSDATTQETIARARAWAGHLASCNNANVSHANINPIMGGYPLDGVSRPIWMRTETEATFTHYSQTGQMVPAMAVTTLLQLAAFEAAGVPIDKALVRPFRLDRLPGR